MDASVERSGILASASPWAPDHWHSPLQRAGQQLPAAYLRREMKGFAESFELRGGNELESQQM